MSDFRTDVSWKKGKEKRNKGKEKETRGKEKNGRKKKKHEGRKAMNGKGNR